MRDIVTDAYNLWSLVLLKISHIRCFLDDDAKALSILSDSPEVYT